jgi:Protein of unknown function (DUF3551)
MKGLIGACALMLLAGVTDARAQGAWCVFYDASTYNCGFSTYQQCLATSRGSGGYCRPNPFEAPREQRRSRSK